MFAIHSIFFSLFLIVFFKVHCDFPRPETVLATKGGKAEKEILGRLPMKTSSVCSEIKLDLVVLIFGVIAAKNSFQG